MSEGRNINRLSSLTGVVSLFGGINMTVKSLIKKLSVLDGNAEVKLRLTDEEYNISEGTMTDYEVLDGILYLDAETEEFQ